jgi:hypothetical protein
MKRSGMKSEDLLGYGRARVTVTPLCASLGGDDKVLGLVLTCRDEDQTTA